MKPKKTKVIAAKQRWISPSCKFHAKAAFCPSCGEVAPLDFDRPITLLELSKQMLHGVTSLDGRFIRSVRYLVLAPAY